MSEYRNAILVSDEVFGWVIERASKNNRMVIDEVKAIIEEGLYGNGHREQGRDDFYNAILYPVILGISNNLNEGHYLPFIDETPIPIRDTPPIEYSRPAFGLI